VSSARLRIHLQPRAAHDRIVGWHGGALKVQVHAAPVDGAANDALLALLAAALHVPRRQMRIVSGATSRNKLITIDDMTDDECAERVAAAR